jgi:aldehyde dehydrogenase (NAD+)
MGGLYNTGQDCTCGSRIYVQSTVYEKFLDIVKRKVKEYKVGDGFSEDSSAGPLVRLSRYLALIIDGGIDI